MSKSARTAELPQSNKVLDCRCCNVARDTSIWIMFVQCCIIFSQTTNCKCHDSTLHWIMQCLVIQWYIFFLVTYFIITLFLNNSNVFQISNYADILSVRILLPHHFSLWTSHPECFLETSTSRGAFLMCHSFCAGSNFWYKCLQLDQNQPLWSHHSRMPFNEMDFSSDPP